MNPLIKLYAWMILVLILVKLGLYLAKALLVKFSGKVKF